MITPHEAVELIGVQSPKLLDTIELLVRSGVSPVDMRIRAEKQIPVTSVIPELVEKAAEYFVARRES